MADSKKMTAPKVTQPSDLQELKEQINHRLSMLVFELDPSANTISTASSAYTRFYGFKEQPQFIEDWTRYGPPFISSVAMKLVRDKFGDIRQLNEFIKQRLQARATKNFSESDRIRDELAAKGIVLKDSKDGTSWEIAR